MIQEDSEFTGWIGMATDDITPPAGIYFRNWGAAKRHVATGIHRPLNLSCMVLQESCSAPLFVLVTMDLGWWKSAADEKELRYAIIKEFQLEASNLLICLSHTHSGPVIFSEDADKEGGEYIVPYLALLREKTIKAVKDAITRRETATLSWRYGTCDLAANRDFPDPEEDGYLVGYNPGRLADHTLLVGRITDMHQNIIGTIVNYACHPTTLAWDNQLISPDFIGAMRELVCEKTGQSPCLFLQGASGDLAPAHQYTGDSSVADRHGRQLGHSVLSVLEAMYAPNTKLVYKHKVESGAPLAVWQEEKQQPSAVLCSSLVKIELNLKHLDSLPSIEQQLKNCTDPVLRERLWRMRGIYKTVGAGRKAETPLWIWRIGEMVIAAQANEAYSDFQTNLRKHLPTRKIAVVNIANGYVGYLPPIEMYNRNQYAVWQTPFEAGCLEKLTATALNEINRILTDKE